MEGETSQPVSLFHSPESVFTCFRALINSQEKKLSDGLLCYKLYSNTTFKTLQLARMPQVASAEEGEEAGEAEGEAEE